MSMMSAMAPAGGGALGGLLGQVGDVLSAPRRGLWSILGLPDSGHELLSQNLGMDPDSPWTHALGMGAEMLGDPLSYVGALGGVGAKLGLRGLGRAGPAAGEMADLGGAAARKGPGWMSEYKSVSPTYVAPPMPDPQGLDAIHAGLEADAAKQAAQEALHAPPGVAGAPGQELHGIDLLAANKQGRFGAAMNAYRDLHEDLSSGAMLPEQALAPRLGAVGDLFSNMRGMARQGEALAPAEAAALRQAAIDSDLSHYLMPAGLVRGVDVQQGQELLARLGVPPVSVAHPDLTQPIRDLLFGELAPEKVQPLFAGLRKMNLPLDTEAMGNDYLHAMREGLGHDMPGLMRHGTQSPNWTMHAPILGGNQAMQDAVRQAEIMHQRLPGYDPFNAHFDLQEEAGQRKLREAIGPLLEELIGSIRQRAGL